MATGTEYFEDLTVTYECRLARCDYGVARSPIWYEPEDIKIIQVEILGVEVDIRDIQCNRKLYEKLLDYADNIEDWE
jgi:hypothetical protein